MTIEQLTALMDIREMAKSGRAREIRRAAGLSVHELGAAVGVAGATVARWEVGDRRPHGDAALRYASVIALIRARADRRQGGL